MRVLFIMANRRVEISVQLPGFELPEAIAVQQREFDDRLAESLDAMAMRNGRRFRGTQENLQEARARLERTIQAYRPNGTLEGRFDALLLLVAKSNLRSCPSVTRSKWRRCIVRLPSGSHAG